MTFVVEHCPELIELGYVYIATPPLYKVNLGKGKHVYLQDKSAYLKFINRRINKKYDLSLDGEEVLNKKQVLKFLKIADTIGQELEDLSINKCLEQKFLETVILNYHEDDFKEIIAEEFPEIKYKAKSKTLVGLYNNKFHKLIIDEEFEKEIEELEALYGKLGSGYIDYKEKDSDEYITDTIGLAINRIMKSVKPKSMNRYKGLGEMDASELWESSMNPETRTLIQVTTENVKDSRNYFAMFMSSKDSQVKLRKKYIFDVAKEYDFDEIIEG